MITRCVGLSLLVLGLCPHSPAATFGAVSAGPNSDGLASSPLAAADVGGRPIETESMRILWNQDGKEVPLTEDQARTFSPQVQEKLQILLEDSGIQDMAQRVRRADAQRPSPITILFDPEYTGVSHFYRGRVTLARDLLLAPPPREGELTEEILEHRRKSFRRTTVHELGHALAYRLYQSWLPEVDYQAREVMSIQSSSHWQGKETSESSAWSEGFAEALGAFFAEDEGLSTFSHRKTVYMGISRPRTPDHLDNVEGFVAFCQHDFWGPNSDSTRLDRTLETLQIQHRNQIQSERHKEFGEYLREHLRLFPQDAVRWSLVLWGNSLLQESSWIYSGSFSQETQSELKAIRSGLERLSRRLNRDRVAEAIVAVLQRGEDLGGASQSLGKISREAETLHALGKPIFEIPNSGGDKYETMPLPELKKVVENAKAAEQGLFQQYGYDFHPQVKEAKARWEKLLALYRRRGGR